MLRLFWYVFNTLFWETLLWCGCHWVGADIWEAVIGGPGGGWARHIVKQQICPFLACKPTDLLIAILTRLYFECTVIRSIRCNICILSVLKRTMVTYLRFFNRRTGVGDCNLSVGVAYALKPEVPAFILVHPDDKLRVFIWDPKSLGSLADAQLGLSD